MRVPLLFLPTPFIGSALRLPPLRVYDRQQLGGELAALFGGEVIYRELELLTRADFIAELQKPWSLPPESYSHLINTFALFASSWVLSNYWNERLGYLPRSPRQLFDETLQLSVGTANCILLSLVVYLVITKCPVDVVAFESEAAFSVGLLWLFRLVYFRTRPPLIW